MTLSDPDFVTRQYRDASNLGARISLHRRFGTDEKPLPRWIFAQLDLPPEGRILELGCGPGLLWTENGERLPAYLLSDAADKPDGEFCQRVADLAGRLERELDLRGAIHVTTDPGLFVARR